ncbi:hypothetical protein Pint_07035 [Pistacia integerrima]|uniref:Uncharacterized protein n=1 Tax=Pistacia integerrima TaxID=434235 RepID=A0ACC0XVE4_9ROSI|nr:hypothetical protein Pint_07035 [Pistacia integerrima]
MCQQGLHKFFTSCRVLLSKRVVEEKAQAIRAAPASSFKSMLKEKWGCNCQFPLVQDNGSFPSEYSSAMPKERTDNGPVQVVVHHPVTLEKDNDPRLLTSPLKFPGKLAIDIPNNRLLISDSNHNRIVAQEREVYMMDPSRRPRPPLIILKQGLILSSNIVATCFLAYNAKKNILYVADTENHALREIDFVNEKVQTLVVVLFAPEWRVRLFSEYLGMDTMFAIVCKTYEANDPQRRLDILKPRLPNGESPLGFLGFAVNMIDVESKNWPISLASFRRITIQLVWL